MYAKSTVLYRLQSRPTEETANGRPWRYEEEHNDLGIIKRELRLSQKDYGDRREFRILRITETVTEEEVTL